MEVNVRVEREGIRGDDNKISRLPTLCARLACVLFSSYFLSSRDNNNVVKFPIKIV